ncbi:MAG: hypothetical protein RhofKO_38820 [Rhodothermales bacterium]
MLGCDSVAVDDEGVTLRIQGETLVAQNATGRALYYFVVGQEASHLIDWAPIISDEIRIDPRRSKTIPFDLIPMEEDEEKLLFYWWHANADGTGPDAIRTLAIDL